jgi:hypothetical protein
VKEFALGWFKFACALCCCLSFFAWISGDVRACVAGAVIAALSPVAYREVESWETI